MYKCKYCHIQSEYKYNIDRHEKRHNANTAPTTMYVDDNNPPTKIGSNVQQNVIHPPSNIQNQHNSQYGTGENTHIPIEDYREVVGIAHEWKKECEIKDNGIHARNEFLTANNHKLQVEHMRNKMLDVENERLQEENKKLELEKESLVEDGNNMVSAMGQDMAKVIRENKQLKNEKKKPSNSNLGATTGRGYKTNKFKAPTTLKIGSSSRIAPTSFYITNDGREYYRGENELVDVGTRDIRSKGIGGMLRVR